ncbi:MAG TPA: hypothetical protein VLQ46_01240 [Casimicrobiaceae bacterium]|nr:hypothetical protein [Casimicrobiaceae bacterium]
MPILLRCAFRFLFATALLVGCSAIPSPTNTTAWRDPDFKGPPFRKVFVIGLSAQSLTDQRGFENLMVSALQSTGVSAVPGWQYVPTDRTPDQAMMRAAVLQSGADATLLVRLSGFQTEGSMGVGTVGGGAAVGPNMYVGWYEPGIVSTSYQAATIYTTLFDVKTANAVWTYNPPTYNPATLQQQAPAFANDVAGMLQSSGLLATR